MAPWRDNAETYCGVMREKKRMPQFLEGNYRSWRDKQSFSSPYFLMATDNSVGTIDL